jgi:hypothetical protein
MKPKWQDTYRVTFLNKVYEVDRPTGHRRVIGPNRGPFETVAEQIARGCGRDRK